MKVFEQKFPIKQYFCLLPLSMYHHPWYMPQTAVKSDAISGTDCTVNSHHWYLFCVCSKYKGCPESIQPFWISRELATWHGCNLAASQKRPYCLCTVWPSHSLWPSEQISFTMTMCLLILQLSCRFFFLAKHHITQVCQHPYSSDLAPRDFWFFPKLKTLFKGRRFMNATVTQYASSVNGVSLPTD
jgi:hypothetical protein